MDADLSAMLTEHLCPEVERVEASFVRRKEFSYLYRLSKGVLTVQLCDYLQDAPERVLVDTVEMILSKARKIPSDTPRSLVEFLDDDGFILSNRPTYIRRSKNLIRNDIGKHHTIPDSLQRLMDQGLLTASDIDNSWFSWTRQESVRRLGFCSTLFRVVGISAALDSAEVPDSILDYVVYHECLHLRQRYRPDHRVHDAQFRGWEHSYPDWRGCEQYLRGMSR